MPGEKKDEQMKMEARFDELNSLISNEEKQLARERIIGESIEKEEPKKRSEIRNLFGKSIVW